MNENLFTFPGGTADASGDNPFDLSGFTELTGSNTQNPFADLLAGGEATEQPPAEGAGAVQADDSIPEEKDETDQNHETVEEDESHEISKSPAPQDPQPKSPPAPKSEEDHASDKPEEAEDNPLLAAMERQEEKTAPKVAEPIFAQLPVFSYNGSEAPIEDTEQTFDELRLSKLTDFPEFDEAQSLSWKVVYGKIVKEIVLPKKTKIGQIKREIETSKEFINALKKATDKHPKCLVKPSISMQKKGDASAYKGAFLYLSEAQASPKTITFIPGRDGKVYERRITGAGEFVTPAENITVLDEIRPGFHPSLPRIPYSQKIKKNSRAPARHKAEDDYLLTTKLFCGMCGAMMFGECGTGRNKVVHHYYKCATAKRFKTCKKKTVRKEWLEDLVIAETMKLIQDDAVIDAIVAEVMELQDQENTTLPLLEKQMREVENGIENMLNAIQAGVLTNSTKSRLEKLEAQQKELEIRIAEEKIARPRLSENQVRFWLTRFRKLDPNVKSHRETLINTFVNAVYLYDEKVLIAFNYKDGTKTISFNEIAAKDASEGNGSDLGCFAPPRTPVSNGYRSFCFTCLEKGAARVDSNSCGAVAEDSAKTAQWAVFSSAACVIHPRP